MSIFELINKHCEKRDLKKIGEYPKKQHNDDDLVKSQSII